MSNEKKLPLVYSCSGASSAAQMANYIAVKLDRLKIAEMSCIAGVGGDVKPLVRTAKSGRPILVLDGCPLQCAAHILKRHGLKADQHYDLSKMGVKKKYHEDFDPVEAAGMLDQIAKSAEQAGHSPSSEAEGIAEPPSPAVSQKDGTELSSPFNPLVEDEEETPEYASPACSMKEFKDW